MIRSGSSTGKAAAATGISMLKVPQLVPVAKARKIDTRKITAGSIAYMPDELPAIRSCTNSAAPREEVTVFIAVASVRIRMEGIMALKPLGRHSEIFLKLTVFRTAKYRQDKR